MPPDNITELLAEWRRGDHAAETRLFDALYEKLRSIATQCLRTERNCQTLGPSALVHEAYLRFTRSENLFIADRTHFLALAARVMRRIILDRARARLSEKRGGYVIRTDFSENVLRTDAVPDEIIEVDRALSHLSLQSPRLAQLVELRYFGGYTFEECAVVLGVSGRTARREWQIARTRLKVALDAGAAPYGSV